MKNLMLKFRRDRELTRKQAAQLLGCSVQLITSIETGHRKVSPAMALKFEHRSGGDLSRFDMRPDIYPREGTAA